MKIVIIDYNAGNVHNVLLALHRLGIEGTLSRDPEVIRAADKVIFPGVGEASTTMAFLNESGLGQVIRELTQPVLGICLGMQLLCQYSEENDTPCLDILPSRVTRFPATGKVPHMGWNVIKNLKGPLFKDIDENSYVYFVHSYYVPMSEYTVATTDYLLDFAAATQYKNFYAVQFHPEKSGDTGLQILKNFIAI